MKRTFQPANIHGITLTNRLLDLIEEKKCFISITVITLKMLNVKVIKDQSISENIIVT